MTFPQPVNTKPPKKTMKVALDVGPSSGVQKKIPADWPSSEIPGSFPKSPQPQFLATRGKSLGKRKKSSTKRQHVCFGWGGLLCFCCAFTVDFDLLDVLISCFYELFVCVVGLTFHVWMYVWFVAFNRHKRLPFVYNIFGRNSIRISYQGCRGAFGKSVLKNPPNKQHPC